MNTKALEDHAPTTTGGRLRQAREKMGLSQQAVAERLCLKVSTVHDIENDHANPNLASTFLRGYIRSYARLVHLSEEELMPMMAKQEAPIKIAQVTPMQSFSLGTSRKMRDSWLMRFIWMILFVIVGLTGVWWWQYYQVQQQEIANMAVQSSSHLCEKADSVSQPLAAHQPEDNNPAQSVAAPAATSISCVWHPEWTRYAFHWKYWK